MPARHHGHHDFVKLFLEFEDQLNTRDFVSGAEINGFRGIDEIHGVCGVVRPSANLFEVEARLFLLKQYPHR